MTLDESSSWFRIRPLTDSLTSASGSFSASLLGGAGGIKFNLSLGTVLALTLSPTQTYSASATIVASDQGLTISNLTLPSGIDSIKYLSVGGFNLGVGNLRVPTLSYAQGKWNFDLQLDAAFVFPFLSADTIAVKGIDLTPSGFTIPQINVPQLAVPAVSVAGFSVQATAFRTTAPITYNWFTGQGPSNWGFGVDLQIAFAGLGAGAPAGLSGLKLSVLNAGFSNGVITGTVESQTLPTPISLGWGSIAQVGGSLTAQPNGSQGIAVTAKGTFRTRRSSSARARTGAPAFPSRSRSTPAARSRTR